MDDLMKMMTEMEMDNDIAKFIENNSNEQGIDTSKLYIGQCTYKPKRMPLMKAETDEEIKANTELNAQQPFRILIDSGVRTAHNRFFVDIINKISIGDAHGWTGFGCVPNTGVCVEELDLLSNKSNKERMSLEEIIEFVNDYNKSNAQAIDINSLDVDKLQEVLSNEDAVREYLNIVQHLQTTPKKWNSIFNISDEVGVVEETYRFGELGFYVGHKFTFTEETPFKKGWENLVANGYIKDNLSSPIEGKQTQNVGLFYVSDKFIEIYTQCQNSNMEFDGDQARQLKK